MIYCAALFNLAIALLVLFSQFKSKKRSCRIAIQMTVLEYNATNKFEFMCKYAQLLAKLVYNKAMIN